MKRLLMLFALCASVVCGAQQTANETFTVSFNNGTTSPGPPTSTNSGLKVVRNIGQASHWVYYCPPGQVTSMTAEIEGSSDGVKWTAISEIDSDTTCTVIEAGGYYPQIRILPVSVSAISGGTLTFFYSSSTAAIPGSGAARGNKSAQPVMNAPANKTFSNTNLKSTAATITTLSSAIYAIDVTNTNASVVYVVITGTTPSSPAVYGFQANTSRSISMTSTGQQIAPNATVACSTNPNGTGDPATGCVVTMVYRNFSTVNVNVNAGGTSVQTSNPSPGGP